MTLTSNSSVGSSINRTKPVKNLSLQDAIIAVAVYASQLNPDDCDEDIKKIQSLAQDHSLFNEDPKKTRSRIYRFANYMNTEKVEEFVNLAAASSTVGTKKIAYKWAVELSLDKEGSLGEKKKLLDDLSVRLAIDADIADKINGEIINKKTSQ